MEKKNLEKVMGSLSERERLVIQLRWLTKPPWTLEEVGKKLGISRARVRQIEKDALEKLRRASR
jgi:RNA polymerase sigma factor (sigma-70 family)